MAGALMTVLGDPAQWGRWLHADSWLVVADRCRAEGRPIYAVRAELIAKGLRDGWPTPTIKWQRGPHWRIAEQWNSDVSYVVPVVRDTDGTRLPIALAFCERFFWMEGPRCLGCAHPTTRHAGVCA